MTEPHPKDSPERRQEIYDAVDAVLREAANVVRLRSHNERWETPGDLDEFGDNYGLIRIARNEVLDQLQARITEAYQVLDRIEDEAKEASGITWRP